MQGTKIISFYKWLGRFKGEESAIGDLARDIYDDSGFPRNADSKEEIRNHLVRRNAVQNCLDTLDSAWQRYITVKEWYDDLTYGKPEFA